MSGPCRESRAGCPHEHQSQKASIVSNALDPHWIKGIFLNRIHARVRFDTSGTKASRHALMVTPALALRSREIIVRYEKHTRASPFEAFSPYLSDQPAKT
ncbi:hypothetical protein XI25_29155 [Paenibacillus sp. DMB20]|nr:hypothetical protein XI25_29155 [Paenibacillus sp. DMB20]